MPKSKHPYFDPILNELASLGQVVPRAMFGHEGYAIGTSVFAFLDESALVVKTECYKSDDTKLPKGLTRFIPGDQPSKTWIAISFDDSLDSLRKHWPLIEESYRLAAVREISKAAKVSNQKTMTKQNGDQRTCPKGHTYFKSSDCPTCPKCEAERRPATGFLSMIAAPARRALESKGIKTLAQLSSHTEAEILDLHGMGKSSIPKLKAALHQEGLTFKDEKI